MKKLTDYQEEIHKCSKCGLCQSVCPVYRITGNDCTVSRGKFIMLNGIIKGDLKLNKNINKYLDMCLKCNACKDFCPSGIDARKIFLTAKAQYFEKCPSSIFTKLFQSKFVFKSFLNSAKIVLNIYRFLKLDRILKGFYPIVLKMGRIGKKIVLANEFINNPSCKVEKMQKDVQNNKNKTKIIYFKGCVNEFINPRTKAAAENILKRLDVEILPAKFDCCGIPFLSAGNAEQFKRQAIFNLSQIPDDFDYFLTDCASCQSAFKEYENYIEDEILLKKLGKINQKSINVIDFIMKSIKHIEFKNRTTFTFHKPCHLEDLNFLLEFLNKAKNVEYIEMKDFDKCCGFSGEFALKNPKLSEQISIQKAQNASETKADYVLTSCPACILGLLQGSIENAEVFSPLNIIEFVSLAEKIC